MKQRSIDQVANYIRSVSALIITGALFPFYAANAATHCVSTADELVAALNAVGTSSEANEIHIAQSRYINEQGFFETSTTQNLVIKGGYTSGCASREVDPSNTVIDGNEAGAALSLRVPTGHTAGFLVDGLTLTRGRTGTAQDNVGGGLQILKVSRLSSRGINRLDISIPIDPCATDPSCFDGLQGGNVILSNSIIDGNLASGSGGGVYINNFAEVTLVNNRISNNRIISSLGVAKGGGIAVRSVDKAVLTDNIIEDNIGEYQGGGVYLDKIPDITVANNRISGNTNASSSASGGGIRIDAYLSSYNDRVVLTNNTIESNSTGSYGGGAYITRSSTVKLSANTISGNSSSYGGGIRIDSPAELILRNNVVINNEASVYGGGVYVREPAEATFTNNTISNNSSDDNDGGGLRLKLRKNFDRADIYNNIIWGNTQGGDIYLDNDGDENGVGSEVNMFNNNFDQSSAVIKIPFEIDGSNFNNIDPSFVDEVKRLEASSQMVNVGNNNAPKLPQFDRECNPRIVDGIVDIGAYEHIASSSNAGNLECYRITESEPESETDPETEPESGPGSGAGTSTSGGGGGGSSDVLFLAMLLSSSIYLAQRHTA